MDRGTHDPGHGGGDHGHDHAGHDHGHAGHDHGHAHPEVAAAPHKPHAEGELPFNPWIIFFILVGLTGISWGADKLSGSLSVLTISVLVMFVSTCKASLVVGYFMHFRYEGSWKYILTVPPMIMGVLLALALVPDVGRRQVQAEKKAGAAAAHSHAAHGPDAPGGAASGHGGEKPATPPAGHGGGH